MCFVSFLGEPRESEAKLPQMPTLVNSDAIFPPYFQVKTFSPELNISLQISRNFVIFEKILQQNSFLSQIKFRVRQFSDRFFLRQKLENRVNFPKFAVIVILEVLFSGT